MLKDATKTVGARNERHLCAVIYDKLASFAEMNGVLDEVLKLLEVPSEPDGGNCGYYLRDIEGLSIFYITPLNVINFIHIFNMSRSDVYIWSSCRNNRQRKPYRNLRKSASCSYH